MADLRSLELMARYEAAPQDTHWISSLSFEEMSNFVYRDIGRSDDIYRELYDMIDAALEKYVRRAPWPKYISTERLATADHVPFSQRLGIVEMIDERKQEAYVRWIGGGANVWSKVAIMGNRPSRALLETHLKVKGEEWRLKDTIYKTSAEAQAAIDQMNAEYSALTFEQRLDCKIPTVIGHTETVRDLLILQEHDR